MSTVAFYEYLSKSITQYFCGEVLQEIGLELICAYAAFGTKIAVVEAMDHILPMLDEDLTKIGMCHMKKIGIKIQLEHPVQLVERGLPVQR